MSPKHLLTSANSHILQNDHEGFLSYCTDDTEWHFIDDLILKGKDAVLAYMKTEYLEAPQFKVEKMIGQDDMVVAIGTISVNSVPHAYSDVWTVKEGKLWKLKAFVIKLNTPPQ